MRFSRRDFLVAGSACAGSVAVRRALGDQLPAAKLAADGLRPQYHLLPPGQWMNDPNGPVYWQGKYHLFYQLNPHDSVWGDMTWGHAVSPDMIHWRNLQPAIHPTPGGPDSEGVFSGSIVKDGERAVAIYTGVSNAPENEATLRDGTHNYREQQCMRVALDPMLRTWSPAEVVIADPPIPLNTIAGFRDPAPWRDGDTWYMVVGSGIRGKSGMALLYKSADLKRWEYLHPLTEGTRNESGKADPVDSGDMWECPDFFPLGGKHVLLYSTERKVFWQVGEYDRKELRFHKQTEGILDYGAFYAPKSQLDADGNRILWGWIQETRPEAEFKRAGWAGCMSLPRVLTVAADNTLRMWTAKQTELLKSSRQVPTIDGACGVVRWVLTDVAPWNGVVHDATGAEFLSWELGATNLAISGKQLPFRANLFAGGAVIEAWFDGSVIEVFANGVSCFVLRHYSLPQGGLKASGGTPAELRSCTPISRDRMTG